MKNFYIIASGGHLKKVIVEKIELDGILTDDEVKEELNEECAKYEQSWAQTVALTEKQFDELKTIIVKEEWILTT